MFTGDLERSFTSAVDLEGKGRDVDEAGLRLITGAILGSRKG